VIFHLSKLDQFVQEQVEHNQHLPHHLDIISVV